jgi:hypothetical protein
MKNQKWQTEFKNFEKLDLKSKVAWMSKLLFLLSMFARTTYEAGTDRVSAPEMLRKFNEIIHRSADFQLDLVRNEIERRSDEDFFDLLAAGTEEVGCSNDLLRKLSKSL